MSTPLERPIPAPITVSASLAALEGAALLIYGILELFNISGGRAVMGLTTSLFFAVYGAGLLWAAWAMRGGASSARSPIVFTQLLMLGLAWSFRGGETTQVAIVLAVVAVVVLAGSLHPASVSYLVEEDSHPPADN